MSEQHPYPSGFMGPCPICGGRRSDAVHKAPPVPADPPSPLTAEEARITMVCDTLWDNGVYMADSVPVASEIVRRLATLDAARAPDAGLRAALERLDAIARVETRNAVGEAEFTDALAQSFTALHPGKRPVWPDDPMLRAALASSPAPAGLHTWAGHVDCDPATCTVAHLARSSEWHVPAPAGLDVERLATALDEAWSPDDEFVDDVTTWITLATNAAALYDLWTRAATRPAEDAGERPLNPGEQPGDPEHDGSMDAGERP